MNPSEQIQIHYHLEKELARRILDAAPDQRTQVAMDAYGELFARIPWHPQLTISPQRQAEKLAEKWLFYGSLIGPQSAVVDIGAGDAAWTRRLARHTRGRCLGIDVSAEILSVGAKDPLPANLELQVMDAVRPTLAPATFDVALSSQLVEHLHPDDVPVHFSQVRRILRSGGVYAFDTPSRLTGPHDVSRHFDRVATGFHLKEWTMTELDGLLKGAGFRHVRTQIIPWEILRSRPGLYRHGLIGAEFLRPFEAAAWLLPPGRARLAFAKLFRISRIILIACVD